MKPDDQFAGIFLGLAVGDALGATLEFGPRRPLSNLHTEMTGGGPFRLQPGEWTDDTAMAVALAASLIHHRAFQPLDVLHEWAAWYRDGRHSCTGTCFDIGNATRTALEAFLLHPDAPPKINPSALGNGTLMRLAPVVLFARDESEAASLAYDQSILTHGEDAAIATASFARLLFHPTGIPASIAQRPRGDVSASGFYKDTLEAALWAVATTSSFEDALIAAVNLGDDADTVGAVTGQLAGAVYGLGAIPPRWLAPLAWRDQLLHMAEQLIAN
jgi:ADP-ribosyl-[dinitrogen reductase] hydrolase